MGRRALGFRSTSHGSSASGIHQYFLRSTSTSTRDPAEVHVPKVTDSARSNASNSPVAERSLKKKPSIWSAFTRASSRKASAASTSSSSDAHLNDSSMSMTMRNVSTLSISMPISNANHNQMHVDKFSPSLHDLMHLDTEMANLPCTGMNLRSQRSLQTLRADGAIPILRHAQSQYLPRHPQLLDGDCTFSDESEGEVSVSWVTSTGLRKVGMHDDDEIMDTRY